MVFIMIDDQAMNARLMGDLSKGFNEILKSFITTNVVNKEMKFCSRFMIPVHHH